MKPKTNSGRFDSRSKDEFKSDILRAHNIQRWLIDYWVKEMAANSYYVEWADNGGFIGGIGFSLAHFYLRHEIGYKFR